MKQSTLLLLFAVLCLSSFLNPSIYVSALDEDVADEPAVETVTAEATETVEADPPAEDTASTITEESTPEEEEEEEEEVAELVETEEQTVTEDAVVEEAPEEDEIVEEESPAVDESTESEIIEPEKTTVPSVLKENVLSKFDCISDKIKEISITQQNVKKIAAFGLGAWGAATGAGWAMNQFKKDA